jgi:hypothetical protein
MPLRPFVVACAVVFAAAPLTAAQDQAPAAAPPADTAEIHFSGEVARGQAFTRDIGHHLAFRLTPATANEGGGWVIEILPPVEPADDPVEFSAIATPPYHQYNDRYVAGAFGYSAREAVQATLRKFNFVESADDAHRADEVVNAVLYPSTIGEADKPHLAAESAAILLGTGELKIVHAHLSAPKDGGPEIITDLKFEVTIRFDPGLTLQQVLAPHPPTPKK